MKTLIAITCLIAATSAFAMTGVVKSYDAKGTVVITPDGGGQDLSVDRAQLVGATAASLKPGQKVTFDIRVENVRVVEGSAPPPPKDPASTTDRTGTVTTFSDAPGFGFVRQDGGTAEFLAKSSSITEPGVRTLRAGQRVRFELKPGLKGMEAQNIRLIK